MLRKILFIIGIIGVAASCKSDNSTYKAILDLKKNEWFINKSLNYTFEINDEATLYNISLLVRNTSAYPYYNLYTKYELRDEKGNVLKSKLEEVILFDPKSGKPFGDGLGDIYDHKYKFATLSNLKFPAKGKYKLKLIQYMRQDPLKGLVSVGINVEPISSK